MKNKILNIIGICILVVLLIVLTGCSNSNDSQEEKNKVTKIVSTPTTYNNESLGVTTESGMECIFTPEGKLEKIIVNVKATLSEDSSYTMQEYEESIRNSFENSPQYQSEGIEKNIEVNGNELTSTVTFNMSSLTGNAKEQYAEYENMSYDEMLKELNQDRDVYYYNPNDPEQVTVPDDIQGAYVDDLKGIFQTDPDYKLTYKFVHGTLFESRGVLDNDDYPYEYENGTLTIKKGSYDEVYQVKSNYKGYDLVLLDEDNYEAFRGNAQ